MSQEDDLRGLSKVMDFMRALSILFVVIHIYWYCYGQILAWNVNIGVIDRILLNFDRTAGLFGSILYTKLFAVLFLGLSCLGTKGVKEEEITWRRILAALAAGFVLFFFNWWLLDLPLPLSAVTGFYILTLSAGYICLLMGGVWMSRLLKNNMMDDPFNNENESFMQETRLVENEYSVNLPTRFYYNKRWHNGFANVVVPQRACICVGVPGSGKSYAVVNQFIKQQIEKGYTMYVYDFKFPDLAEIAYNHLLMHQEGYKKVPTFYVINFDDPRRSHRCNPINPAFMNDISDAYESAYTIMLNLNKTWVQKQGDFFVESPIILFAAVIWFLRIYDGGKYCTFPHAIEFLNKRYEDIFPILTSYPELENYLSPFMDAWLGGAQDQLQGQIASAKIPLSRMISPQLYWVMSGDDFTLDINNPDDPKVLAVGNNPDRQNIYGAVQQPYRKAHQQEGAAQIVGHHRRAADDLLQGPRQPDRHGPEQQGSRVARIPRLQPAQTRLRRQGGRRGDEHRGQHLLRAGSGRNGQDALGAVRQGAAKATEHDPEPQRQIDLHIDADGQPDPGLEDLDAHAGDVRRGRGRQLRAAYRAEDIPRRNRRGQREGQGRDGPLREDTHNHRFHGRERRGSHAGNDQRELRPHQGRSRGDRR